MTPDNSKLHVIFLRSYLSKLVSQKSSPKKGWVHLWFQQPFNSHLPRILWSQRRWQFHLLTFFAGSLKTEVADLAGEQKIGWQTIPVSELEDLCDFFEDILSLKKVTDLIKCSQIKWLVKSKNEKSSISNLHKVYCKEKDL